MGIVNIEQIENIFLCLALSAFHVAAAGASAAFKSRPTLQLEKLALRHQLGVLRRSVKRRKLTPADRLLWIWLCEVWSDTARLIPGPPDIYSSPLDTDALAAP